MQWLWAWVQQIVGPPRTDPWEDDPRIRAERHGQHARIDKATVFSGQDQMERRIRERRLDTTAETWRRGPDGA